jgi:transketolase
MRKQFSRTVMDLAGRDDRIVLVLGDVSVYLFREFKEKYPERFYNMGICENALISTAAGLSAEGLVPFVHTIAPFITERSLEQIKLDLCYNRFAVNFVSCGASFDYAWDGASHHCYTDLAILRLLPEMEVVQPGSMRELDVLLRSQYNSGRSTYFRLSDHPHKIDFPVEFGKAVMVMDRHATHTVMTAGPILCDVLEACRDLSVNLAYFHTIKPIDTEMISRFQDTKIIVVHDAFGLYEAVCGVGHISACYHGLPDGFCSWYGTLPQIRKQIGLDVKGIREFVTTEINKTESNRCSIRGRES